MEKPDGINAKTASILFLMFLFVGSVVVVNFYQEQAIRFTGMVVYGEEDVQIPQDILERLQAGETVNIVVEVDEPTNPLWVSSSDRGRLSAQDKQTMALGKMSVSAKQSRNTPHMSLEVTQDNINELRKNPFIASVHENLRVEPVLDQSIEVINAPEAWEVGGHNLQGQGQTVCVIDTGVDYTHPDLGGCTSEEFLDGQCEKVIGGYDFYNDNNDPIDINGHGTHVAATAAGNGTYQGVAPRANIVALKSMEDGGSLFDTFQSVQWCIDNKDTYNISVISMSLGTGSMYSSYCDSSFGWFADAVDEAVSKGMSVVSATGNQGDMNGVSMPACLQNSMRVTRTNNNDNFASSGNRGAGFNDILAAPGSGIVAAYPGGGFASLSGTSMSTPHVSGAYLLLYQYYNQVLNETLSQQIGFERLNTSGEILYDSQTDMNITRIDAFASLTVQDDFPPTILLSFVEDLEFGEENATITWEITDFSGVQTSNVSLQNPQNQTIFQTNTTNGTFIANTTLLNMTGTYTVKATAKDVNNNTAVETRLFNVKETPITQVLANNQTNLTLFDTYAVNITINTTYPNNFNLTFNNESVEIQNQTFNQTFNVLPGTTLFEVTQQATNTWFEKTKNVSVQAINTTLQIANKTPQNQNVSTLENESTVFEVIITNPLQTNLTSYFSKNNETLATNTSSINLTNMSVGTHDVRFFTSNNQSNITTQWIVNVNATPPTITNTEPQNNVTLIKDANQTFTYNATDYKKRNVSVQWKLNDTIVSTNNTYTLQTHNKTPQNGTLHLTVSNAYKNATHMWNIEIQPALKPLNYTSNISNIEFNEDQTHTLDLEDYLEFDARDNLTHTVNTTINHEIQQNTILFEDGHQTGNANITTTGTKNNDTTNTFNITINEVEEEQEEEQDSASGGGAGGGGGGGGALPPSTNDEEEDEEEEEERVVEEQVAERVIEIRETDTRVLRGIRAQSKKTDFTVNVEEVETTPVNFERNTYRSFRIEANDNVSNASIDFETSKQWLEQNNLTPQDVALYRLNNEWEELETTILEENQTHIFYEAFTPGFSYFTIGEKQREITIEQQTPSPQTPRQDERSLPVGITLWALVGMLAMFGVVYGIKKHNKELGKVGKQE